jgi:hypothetical protein
VYLYDQKSKGLLAVELGVVFSTYLFFKTKGASNPIMGFGAPLPNYSNDEHCDY